MEENTQNNLKRAYKNLPLKQRSFIRTFFNTHRQKTLEIEGIKWQYFDSQTNDPALLLLHGGFADYSMWIHQITAFEEDFRVIAPTCPPIPNATMAIYSQALSTILDRVNVDRLNMMGYSEGGLIAQVFLRDQPNRIDKAVLAHTFYPSSESKYFRYDFNLFRTLPAPLTAWIFRAFAQPDKEEMQADTRWQAWFTAYFNNLKANLTKPLIMTHIDLMMDFVRCYTFHPQDLENWGGKMLITVSADDVVLPYFDGMRRLYPMAETHIFEQGLGAHSVALILPEIFNQRIRAFLG